MRKSPSSPSRRAARDFERGLTLVELLIALALLGFVLLGITPLFIASVKSNYTGNEYTSIHILARDRLEQLMNLPFSDGQLSAGLHDSSSNLATMMPDPATGLPGTGPGAIKNPFTLCYQVFQFQIPGACPTCGAGVPVNASFTPIAVVALNQTFQYKRIDVTVTSGSGALGIGNRRARLSGIVNNPSPESIRSGTDDAGTATCP
jgi:prepilin-type N-terminal cleavage/methylation domain-containing protein